MCSVIGYVGTIPSRSIVLQGLAQTEYRGYDSAGFACFNYKNLLVELANRLEGAYAIVILADQSENTLFFARRKSPLCIGIADEYFMVASDILAFDERIKEVIYVPDNVIGFLSMTEIHLWDFEGNEVMYNRQTIEINYQHASLNGHAHYMIKEMYEQKKAIFDTISFFESNKHDFEQWCGITPEEIKNISHIKLIGCGTSWLDGRIGQFFFESVACISTGVHLASEFRHMPFFNQKNTLSICISQSGETADTLEALRLLNENQVPTVALVNVKTSSMIREAHGSFVMQAGPEMAVASTKAFSTQIASLYWIAHRIAFEKGLINERDMEQATHSLLCAVSVLEMVMDLYKTVIIQQYGPFYAQFDRAICLGRHISYPFALEAALKLKEISYIFAQCYPAGELKHGPLALIDEKTPVFVFSLLDPISYIK